MKNTHRQRRRLVDKTRNGRRKASRHLIVPLSEVLESRITLSTAMISLSAFDTLYEAGALSDSNGSYITVGENGARRGPTNNDRGLIKFNISSAIPAGSTINGALLTMTVDDTQSTISQSVGLYPMTKPWADNSTSTVGSSAGHEGGGFVANNGDATWADQVYNTNTSLAVPWSMLPIGGSNLPFSSTPDSSTNVTTAASYQWSDLATEVQNWLDHPSTNFGWIVIGAENLSPMDTGPGTTLHFDSSKSTAPPMLMVNYTPPVQFATAATLPSRTVNFPFNEQITATNGTPPYSFSLVGGALPQGLGLASNGALTGTPTNTGTSSFTVRVTDSRRGTPTTQTQQFTLTINGPPSLGSLSDSDATLGRAFTATIPFSGGSAPFSLNSPITGLPAGLSASVAGNTVQISGTPTALGNSSFTISGNDVSGAPFSGGFSIDVQNPSASVFQVNTTADTDNVVRYSPLDSSGNISLRSAVEAADEDATAAVPVTDTIVLPAGDYVVNSVLEVSGDLNIVNAPGINPGQIQITANSAILSIDVLQIDPGVSIAIQGIDLTGSESQSFTLETIIYNDEGTLSLSDCEVDHNDAFNSAVLNIGTMDVSNCLFVDNSGDIVAGILNHGALTVVNSTFSGNQSDAGGGAIVNELDGSLSITNSTFTDNSAEFLGGAIENAGNLMLSTSTVAFNSAGTVGGLTSTTMGGGIENLQGNATLIGDIVVGNVSGASSDQAADDIDGVALQPASSFNLVGTDGTRSLASGTSGNRVGVSVAQAGLATENDYGGPTPTLALLPGSRALGAFGDNGALTTLATNVQTLQIKSVTVNNGSVFAASSLPTLAQGSYFTIQIDGEQMAVTGVVLNTNGTATLDVVPGINGVFTTHGAGAGVALASDQRGFLRPAGQPVDIGAFQAYTPLLVNTTADAELSALPGQLSLRDDVNMLSLGSTTTPVSISFDPNVFATSQTIGLYSPLTIGGSGPVETFVINGPAANLTITSAASPVLLDFGSGASVTLTGNITIGTSMDVSGAGASLAAAAVTIDAQGQIAITATATVEGTLSASGSLDVQATGDLLLNSGGVLNVNSGAPGVTVEGTLDAFGDVNIQAGNTDGIGNPVAGGSLDVRGTMALLPASLLTDAGTLTFGAYADSSATLNVDGTLKITAPFTDSSNRLQPGGSADIFGTMTVDSTGFLNDFGTVAVEYSLPNEPGQPLSESGASLDDYGVVSIGDSVSGGLSIDGTVNVEMPRDVHEVFGGNEVDEVFPGGTLNDGHEITVDSGGVFDDGDRVIVYPDASLNVYGTLALLQNPALSIFGTPLFPPGDLTDFGSLTVYAAASPGGTPGTLDDAGTLTVDPGLFLNDTGVIAVTDGGSVTSMGPIVITQTTGKLTVDATSTFIDDDVLAVVQGASADIFGQVTVGEADLIVDTGGTIDDGGTVTVLNKGEMDVDAAGTFLLESIGSFVEQTGPFVLVDVKGSFLMPVGGTASIGGGFTVEPGATVRDGGSFTVNGSLANLTVGATPGAPAGEFTVEGAGASLTLEHDAGAMISGFLNIDSATSLEVETGATLADMHFVDIEGSMDVAAATMSPTWPDGKVLVDSGSTFNVSFGGAVTVEGSLTSIQGLLVVNGILTESTVTISTGGELVGVGSLIGSVEVSSGGILSPGFDIGVLTTGSLTLDPGSDFNAELLSAVPGNYREESVTGTVHVAGATLNLSAFPAFNPHTGDQYIIINNEGTQATSGNFVAGTGIDTVAPGATLTEGAILSTNFLGSARIARLTYLAGPHGNSVAITLSALPPTSHVVNSLGTSQSTDSFPVSVAFSVAPGQGSAPAPSVSSVDLYVSVNGAPSSLYQTLNLLPPQASGTLTFTFAGKDRNVYAFQSVAHDSSGNTETKAPNAIEATTSVPDLNPPVTHVVSSSPSYSWNPFPASRFSGLSASSYSNGVFTLNWAGADPDQNSGSPAGSIVLVNMYVQIDGGSPALIGQLSSGTPTSSGVYSGSMTYSALADGQPHTYNFWSIGSDDQQKKQYAPAAAPAAPDVTFSGITYSAPLAVQNLVVERNLAERSYIRYLDVYFNQTVVTSTELASMQSALSASNASSYVELVWYGLTPGSSPSGSVNLFKAGTTAVSLSGNDLSIDLGPNGITSLLSSATGSPTSNLGDGWYALGIDPTGGSSPATWLTFYRLLGDVNGDGTVTGPYTTAGTDAYSVYHAEGQSGTLLNADANGDAAVNSKDLAETVQAAGRSVGAAPQTFPQFQLLGERPPQGAVAAITQAELQSLVPAAIAGWQTAGLDAADIGRLESATVQVSNLGTSILGIESGGAITINQTAAGDNWYASASAGSSPAFGFAGPNGEELASPGSPAASRVDLLTVLEHEFGHVLGLPDNAKAGDLMDITLQAGVRRVPTAADLAALGEARTAAATPSTAGASVPTSPQPVPPGRSITNAVVDSALASILRPPARNTHAFGLTLIADSPNSPLSRTATTAVSPQRSSSSSPSPRQLRRIPKSQSPQTIRRLRNSADPL